MKRTTERRLLLALLLSSLIPLIALGFLSVAAVQYMGREAQELTALSNAERVRNTLSLRCTGASDRLSSFLRRRTADLRALLAAPRNSENYAVFYRNSLSPLQVEEGGKPARIWIPIYTEIAFADAQGREVLAVRGGRPVSDAELRPASEPDDFVLRALRLPSGDFWTAPAVMVSASGPSAFDGAIRFGMPAYGPDGAIEGTLTATIDPRHVSEQIRLVDLDGAAQPGERQPLLSFFFGKDDTFVTYPALESLFSPGSAASVRDQLTLAVAGAKKGKPSLLGEGDRKTPRFLAVSPFYLDESPWRELAPVGGVAVWSEPAFIDPDSPSLQSITRTAEHRIAALTLVSALCVAVAALLAARRVTRPWARLREKAHALSSDEVHATGDDVDAIARSFDSLASEVTASASRLRASEERLREFLEMSPDGIAVTDFEGRFLHFNRSLCQMLRRTPGELSALHAGAIYRSPDDRRVLLSKLREKGRLSNYEVEFVRGDGSVFPALLTVRLAHSAGADLIEAVVRDISDLVEGHRKNRQNTEALFRVYGELSRAHEQLRRAYDEVEEQVRKKTSELRTAYEALQVSDRVKTEFLMKMSHELRTPLNCIIGFSEAMIDGFDGPLTGDQALSLERIAQSGRRLLRLIEGLLDLSRLDSGRMEFLLAETRLGDVIADVVHQARGLVGDRPITLESSVPENLPVVWVDPDRMRQVLFNLVGNALKFTEKGLVRIEASRVEGREVEVRVTDTGPGVSSEHLESIFQKFVQVPGAKRDGAGLGLAICRELLANMGGKIWAQSTLGAGSTFVVRLPAMESRAQNQLRLPLGA